MSPKVPGDQVDIVVGSIRRAVEQQRLEERELEYCSFATLRIRVVTWNVNNTQSHSLKRDLLSISYQKFDVVVLCLQELCGASAQSSVAPTRASCTFQALISQESLKVWEVEGLSLLNGNTSTFGVMFAKNFLSNGLIVFASTLWTHRISFETPPFALMCRACGFSTWTSGSGIFLHGACATSLRVDDSWHHYSTRF